MDPVAPLDGDMTVNASKQFFTSAGDVDIPYEKGTPFKMAVVGQTQTATGSSSTVETSGIYVFGTGNARKFTVTIDTTDAYNEVRLEKSFDELTWQSVKTYTTGADVTNVAECENLHYRC
jgi:hypothetical protein